MATVGRVEQRVRWEQFADERELQMLFELQIPLMQDESVFVGAA
jgi:hypothetical protein